MIYRFIVCVYARSTEWWSEEKSERDDRRMIMTQKNRRLTPTANSLIVR